MKYLLKRNYFSNEELIYLFEVSLYAGYRDNLIFFENLVNEGRYESDKLTSLLNSLVQKGAILVKIKDGEALSKPLFENGTINPGVNLFLNPEIAYNGRFFKIPIALLKLCRQYDFIEKNGLELPWKVRMNKRKSLAYFCNRYGYLKDLSKSTQDTSVKGE